MNFPKMIRVRQRFPNPTLENIQVEINSQLMKLDLAKTVKKGQTVAVACSSRGIANYSTIVKAVISFLKQMALEPFIVPAMGSHGAATAAGQKRVLEHLGINEKEVEAPIRSSLEVVNIGETEDHIPVYLDKLAAGADHIVLINRIKNTSILSEVDVSAAYEEELSNRKDLEIAIPKRAMVFDQEGNLETF